MNPLQQCRADDLRWDLRLQECLDNGLDGRELDEMEAHLSMCAQCCSRRDDLRSIDAALKSFIDRRGLDASFDRRLFALVDALPHT